MFHTKPAQEIGNYLNTDLEKGLTTSEAKSRLEKYGKNALPPPKKPSLLLKFLGQFTDLLVLILLLSTIVAFFLGETVDAAAILAIVLINAAIGFVQEVQAEKTIESLHKKEVAKTLVIRNGQVENISVEYVVPGDILSVEEGEKIPADARIIESYSLKSDESILTGESTPVFKSVETLSKENLPLGDQTNILFKDTQIVSGRGKAVVVSTGEKTEIGKIAASLEKTKKEKTPLTLELEKVAKLLTIGILTVAIVIFVINFLSEVSFIQSLLVSISLSVAAIPEGLPAIVTIVLSLGVKRLAQKKTIVKRLSSVETLGSVKVIATDKTGTITQNKINAVKIVINEGKTYSIEGEGYKTTGSYLDEKGEIANPASDKKLWQFLKGSVLANDAAIKKREAEIIGDTTEGALLVAAERAKIDINKLREDFPRQHEMPFSSEKKMMSVIVKDGNNYILYAKGAPEVIISLSKLSSDDKKKLLQTTKKLSHSGLRTLAVARQVIAKNKLDRQKESHIKKSSLELLGIVGMHDPLRSEVKKALSLAKDAGVRTIMITGDHQDTAKAIAIQAGIAKADDKVYEDQEVSDMTEDELADKIKKGASVFARISPLTKLKIVNAIKSLPHTQVAVTGDGVNDAPALKAAHIGVAMGQTGTDLTREVADMVITDDNYATIVSAIEQGRVIYANLVKFIRYLISCNLAEVLVVTLGVFLTPSLLPLFPIQILWVNLVTDSLPALALGVDPPEQDVMKLPPRDPSKGILHKIRLIYMTAEGTVIGVSVFLLFSLSLSYTNYTTAQTMTFTALALSQLVHAFNNRSTRKSLFSLGPLTNKYLLAAAGVSFLFQYIAVETRLGNIIFKTESLSLAQWLLVALISLIPLLFVEIKKQLRFRIIP